MGFVLRKKKHTSDLLTDNIFHPRSSLYPSQSVEKKRERQDQEARNKKARDVAIAKRIRENTSLVNSDILLQQNKGNYRILGKNQVGGSRDKKIYVARKKYETTATTETETTTTKATVSQPSSPSRTTSPSHTSSTNTYLNTKPRPVQLVSIGTEANAYAFKFDEDALTEVLSHIPDKNMKVSIVSVVGAFRTGKSFLLSWFLKYLYHLASQDDDDNANDSSAGENDDENKWYENIESIGKDGFHWRGGAERDTTGIYMWSHPFILPRSSSSSSTNGEKVAVILVDSQGMFDHETPMSLNDSIFGSIFGLATLLSSYQIYNVVNRIQEDNLMQLALFSEYGRMAFNDDINDELDLDNIVNPLPKSNPENEDIHKKTTTTTLHKPFQQIEFLVRDWQSFEDDEDTTACEREMTGYLESVLEERDASDLRDTRRQIHSCFDTISCYMMTHPGFKVTKENYSGTISQVDDIFLTFINQYCHKVFSKALDNPKMLNGRELRACELGTYISAYAGMFEDGARFPEATTMLDATTNANNSNASVIATNHYKDNMDIVSGVDCTEYVKEDELDETNERLRQEAMYCFDAITTFGSKSKIEDARMKVLIDCEEALVVYHKLNDGRNPL